MESLRHAGMISTARAIVHNTSDVGWFRARGGRRHVPRSLINVEVSRRHRVNGITVIVDADESATCLGLSSDGLQAIGDLIFALVSHEHTRWLPHEVQRLERARARRALGKN